MKGRGLCLLLTAVLSASVLPVFASCRRGDKISDETRAQLSQRTENAQFMPDAQTVMGQASDGSDYFSDWAYIIENDLA